MIEAVENHMPEVIVIDEIGTELEAAAARTIAERGVQLIATAHGQTLENLLVNPTLNDLLGGIQSVTLSDEEARRRGTQKSVLERKAPPTFDVLVEIQDRDRVAIHMPLADVVDTALRGPLLDAQGPHAHAGRPRDLERGSAPSSVRVRTGARRNRGDQAARHLSLRGEPAPRGAVDQGARAAGAGAGQPGRRRRRADPEEPLPPSARQPAAGREPRPSDPHPEEQLGDAR